MLFTVERAYRELRGEAWNAPVDVAGLLGGMYELREAQRRRATA